MSENGPERFAVVDNCWPVRMTLAMVLDRKPDWRVVYFATNVYGLLGALNREQMTFLYLSESSPGAGVGIIRRLLVAAPALRIVIRIEDPDETVAEDYLRSGARGVVDSRVSIQQFVDAVRRVQAGKVGLSPSIRSNLLSRTGGAVAARQPVSSRAAPPQLTGREADVYRLLGEGLSVKQIGTQLSISSKTVEYHRERLKKKLGLTRSAELVRRATIENLSRSRQRADLT